MIDGVMTPFTLERPVDLESVLIPTVINLSRTDIDCQYIGRRFKGREKSVWANPFKIASDTTASRVMAINVYLDHVLGIDERVGLAKLRGKQLGCWCAPSLCHGHMLATLVNLQRLHGAACPVCGEPLTSILNPWWGSKTQLAEAWFCSSLTCRTRGIVLRPRPVATAEGIVLL